MAIISNDTQDFTTKRTKSSECHKTSKEIKGLRYYFGFNLWLCNDCFPLVKDRMNRISMDEITFTGRILDGYNGNTASVVIVDIGTEFRIYHAHGYYTTPKSSHWRTA